MSADTAIVLLQLVATAILIALNGLFVFHEFAFVAIKPADAKRLEKQPSWLHQQILKGLKELDNYIAVDQLGITVTSIAVGWIGQPVVSSLLAALFGVTGALPGLVPVISAALAFALITGTQMIVGELMPKSVALRHPVRVAQLVTLPVELFAIVSHPLIVVFNGLGRLTVRALGFSAAAESHARVLPVEELTSVLETSAAAGLVSADPGTLRRILHFSDLEAHDLMTPRPDIHAVDARWPLNRVLDVARRSTRTRYPVYDGTIDNIVGLINIKDLIRERRAGRSSLSTSWTRLIRPIPTLPETASIEQLLLLFRQSRQQMVLLIDEYGGTAGIVTTADVAAQLLGGVDDMRMIDDNQYVIQGNTSVTLIENALDVELGGPSAEYDTVGGLVMALRQGIPSVGDHVQVGECAITVLGMRGQRVTQVLLEVTPSHGDAEAEHDAAHAARDE